MAYSAPATGASALAAMHSSSQHLVYQPTAAVGQSSSSSASSSSSSSSSSSQKLAHAQSTQRPQQQQLTPTRVLNSFFAGGIALSTSFAVMHPLDTLKTRMQATPAAQRTNIAAVFTPETMRALRRGFFTSVVWAGPQGGLRWATYEICKHWMNRWNPQPVMRAASASTAVPTSVLPSFGFMVTSASSAIAGDFVSSIIKVPREVITSRLQTGHYDAAATAAGKAKPTAAYAFRTIITTEGPAGLFKGFWSTTLRDWPFMAILFTTYDTLKNIHHHFSVTASTHITIGPDGHQHIHHHEIPTLKSTLFGGVAGGLAAFLTTPFDVIRTRVMTAKAKGRIPMRVIARTIVAENPSRAVQAFFVGGAARSVWWFCVCSMFFPIYERAKEHLDDWAEDRNA
ncbi:mitochondrial carrier domain-containing protein [Geranomyces variabilis]|nr:mitochondrial carrier domain-containing protein [Geranomyces variabilis]KAJ3139220.1 hypothetical protein HDU90_000584 [Geranomyces variabilis]